MKLNIVFLFIICCTFSRAADNATKEVIFDWTSPSIKWEKSTEAIPCLESFNIKVINLPANTTSVEVRIYETTGNNSVNDPVVINNIDFIPYPGVARSNPSTEFIATVIKPLAFRRYYFVEVICTATSTYTPASPASSSSRSRGRRVDESTMEYTYTVTTPAAATPTSGSSVTVTKVERVARKMIPDKVYGLPLKSEISYIDFHTSAGDAIFFKPGIKSGFHNIALVSGLKIRYWPVANNASYDRYALYPHASRWSLTIGAVISDLNYQNTDIKASFLGIKPAIGIDYEIFKHVGISTAMIWGLQDPKIKLSSVKHNVVGFYFGFSFSIDAFSQLKKNLPANNNFPPDPKPL